MRNKKFVKWCVPVTRELDAQVEQAVLADSHVSKSELIRDAVRHLLASNQTTNKNEGKTGGSK
jgi:Arc/MetJ-type ribon-helix-helix transcriptional regulator